KINVPLLIANSPVIVYYSTPLPRASITVDPFPPAPTLESLLTYLQNEGSIQMRDFFQNHIFPRIYFLYTHQAIVVYESEDDLLNELDYIPDKLAGFSVEIRVEKLRPTR